MKETFSARDDRVLGLLSDRLAHFEPVADTPKFGSEDRLTIDPGAASAPLETEDATPPLAVDDSFTLNAAEVGKKGVALDILVNDTPATGALTPKSVQIVDAPDNGTASIRKGALLYKPDPGFEGTDTLTYTVADASGRASNPAQVRIEVRQPDPPRAADDRFTVNAAEIGKKGIALDILVNDTAATGNLNLKSAKIVDAPDNGTASIRKGTLLYKPDPGFEGTDTLTYTVADASGRASNPAQVRIEVRQPDPPRAADDRFTLNAAEVGKKGVALDILVNDTPSTGVLNLKSAQIVDAPDHGTAAIRKGTLLYKPDPGFEGTDTLAYTVADASGRASNSAQVRIEVCQPDPPRAADDEFFLVGEFIGKKGELLDILANDTAATGVLNPKSVTLLDGPQNGKVTVSKGSLLYKPDPGFLGQETFSYTVADGSGRSSEPAQVTIRVLEPPPLPPPLPPGPSGPLAAGEAAGPLLTLAGSALSTPLTLADLLEADDPIGTAGTANTAPDTHTATAPPPGPALDSLITTTDDPAALV